MASGSAGHTHEQRSSRVSRAAAGWGCDEPGAFRRLLAPHARPLSWLSPVPLFKSRNDVLAHLFGDPTDTQRQRWVATRLAEGGRPDLVVDRYAGRDQLSFLVVGDTGEGDASQYCVVPGLLDKAGGTAFMCITSDVVYPAGGVNEYEDTFYRPYRDYPGPIYAVPGNHDWYDGLSGFMRHFCGVEGARKAAGRGDHGSPGSQGSPGGHSSPDGHGGGLRTGHGPTGARGWRAPGRALRSVAGSALKHTILRLLWRDAPEPDPAKLEQMKALRGTARQQAHQPGPYFAIDAGPVLLVGIDTGITEHIDAEQGTWLARISRSSPKPKILLTGTPLYADAAYNPTRIAGTGTTVDDIVRAPEHNYLAAIGGDRHNYQRYPVRLDDGRTIQYIVSGGGGAFLHDTHLIPRVDLPGVSEDAFRCYPLRSDSLSVLSRTYRRRLGWLVGDVYLSPDQAAAILAEELGIEPTRETVAGGVPSDAARRAYRTLVRLPKRFPEPLQEYVQRFFDRNDPPLFKSFLRVDAGADELTIRCFAATGCRAHELDPPLEDAVRCVRDATGRWRWDNA